MLIGVFSLVCTRYAPGVNRGNGLREVRTMRQFGLQLIRM
jgi:hypothetical protein